MSSVIGGLSQKGWLRQPDPTGKRRWPPRYPATPSPGTSPSPYVMPSGTTRV